MRVCVYVYIHIYSSQDACYIITYQPQHAFCINTHPSPHAAYITIGHDKALSIKSIVCNETLSVRISRHKVDEPALYVYACILTCMCMLCVT